MDPLLEKDPVHIRLGENANEYVTNKFTHVDAVSGVIMEHENTVVNLSTYDYPRARNTEVRAAADRFGIALSADKAMTGAQFVHLVVSRMFSEIQENCRVDRALGYMTEVLEEVLPTSSPPKTTDFKVLLQYFMGWLDKVRRVPDVSVAYKTDCPMELDVVDVATAAKSKKNALNTNALKEPNTSMTVTPIYPTYVKHLSVQSLLLIGEILTYNKPLNLDLACCIVSKKIESSRESQINMRQAIDNINGLLQAFDLFDSNDSQTFLKRINITARKRNVVFQASLATDKQILEKNTCNMLRFYLIKMLMGASGDSLRPHDLYKLYVTDKCKVDTLTSVLTTHAATSTFCLHALERLLMLVPSDARIEAGYKDKHIISRAEEAVATGRYPFGSKYHPVDVISLEKRYLCLAFLEAYYLVKFRDYVQCRRLKALQTNLYVLHSVFEKRPEYLDFVLHHGRNKAKQDERYEIVTFLFRLVLDCNMQMAGVLADNKSKDGRVHFCYGKLPGVSSEYPKIFAPIYAFVKYANALKDVVNFNGPNEIRARDFAGHLLSYMQFAPEDLRQEILLPHMELEYVFAKIPQNLDVGVRYI